MVLLIRLGEGLYGERVRIALEATFERRATHPIPNTPAEIRNLKILGNEIGFHPAVRPDPQR